MTGFEKITATITTVVTASAAQITIGNASAVFNVLWVLLGAAAATGMNYGLQRGRLDALKERMDALERRQHELASKDSVEAIGKQLETVIRILTRDT